MKKGVLALDDFSSGLENSIRDIDVQANDLGGKGARLWSLDQSHLDTQTAAGSRVTLTSGAQIWFDNGLVRYDPGVAWDHLAAGAVGTDTFLYAIRVGNGAINYASVEVHLIGTNDTASIKGNAYGHVTEDGTLTASGALTVMDVDDGEAALRAVTAGTAGLSGHGTFEVLADGNWTYQLDNGADEVQALEAGQTLTDSIVVQSLDGTATQTITVTIHGADDYNLIMGTPGADHIEGTSANDHIIGNGSYDLLAGLDGNDWIELSPLGGGSAGGGAGDDRLVGGRADGPAELNNYLDGGDGNDILTGGVGQHGAWLVNEMHGGAGDDLIIGGESLDGTDSFVQNEMWSDGGGNDTLIGAAGAYNRFYLSDGNVGDVARGASDHDTAFVGQSNPPHTYQNHISAQDGFLDYNGAQLWGMDYVYAGGGFGDYTAIVSGDLGELGDPDFYMQVWANSFDAADSLVLDASGLTSTTIGVELSINAEAGSKNTLIGGAGPDRLFSYWYGDDTIYGNAGNDLIVGGYGDNVIDGGTGDDQISLWGYGPGTDTLIFGENSGNDRVDIVRGDTLDISAYSQFHTFADVMAVTTEEYVSGWWITTIQLDAENSIMLTETSISDLRSWQFILAG